MRTAGHTIKKHRIARGITQEELSKILGYRSPQLVSNIERGLCAFPKAWLDSSRVQKALGIKRDTLKKLLVAEFARSLG